MHSLECLLALNFSLPICCVCCCYDSCFCFLFTILICNFLQNSIEDILAMLACGLETLKAQVVVAINLLFKDGFLLTRLSGFFLSTASVCFSCFSCTVEPPATSFFVSHLSLRHLREIKPMLNSLRCRWLIQESSVPCVGPCCACVGSYTSHHACCRRRMAVG